MFDTGIRLQLLVGSTVPLPVSTDIAEALVEVEVRNNDEGRDGFQITLSLGKVPLVDYDLLQNGLLDPPNRVIIMVFIGVLPQVLIDGMITRQQLLPSNQPGQSRLVITGEDISLKLDLEERSATHPNQPDSVIVSKIVAQHGLIPEVTQTTDVPIELDRVPSQQESDLRYILRLAQRNSFVFFVEPTDIPGLTTAYWGPEKRKSLPQPPLTMNMGGETNVIQLSFDYNALQPATPEVTIIDPFIGATIPIPVPGSLLPSLSSQPAQPLRTTISRDAANLNPMQAGLRALTGASQGADTITGTGELDTVRYGRALRSRRLVGVRGVGYNYNGNYYVKQVTHRLKRGEYKQSFTLTRDGRGSTSPVVLL